MSSCVNSDRSQPLRREIENEIQYLSVNSLGSLFPKQSTRCISIFMALSICIGLITATTCWVRLCSTQRGASSRFEFSEASSHETLSTLGWVTISNTCTSAHLSRLHVSSRGQYIPSFRSSHVACSSSALVSDDNCHRFYRQKKRCQVEHLELT